MGCACNKQKTTGLTAKRVESSTSQTTDAGAQQRASDLNARAAGTSQPRMSGRTQSFAMQAGDKTARFGSRLERDAAVKRSGGRAV